MLDAPKEWQACPKWSVNWDDPRIYKNPTQFTALWLQLKGWKLITFISGKSEKVAQNPCQLFSVEFHKFAYFAINSARKEC